MKDSLIGRGIGIGRGRSRSRGRGGGRPQKTMEQISKRDLEV